MLVVVVVGGCEGCGSSVGCRWRVVVKVVWWCWVLVMVLVVVFSGGGSVG